MSTLALLQLIANAQIPSAILPIAHKVLNGNRIDNNECLILFEQGDIAILGAMANYIRESKYGHTTFYNKNFHIEPTNVCVFSCNFCSYSQLYKNREDGWELSIDEMLHRVKMYDDRDVTEVHIVGGVHPKLNLEFFCNLLKAIKAHRPSLHLKGFTAVELDYMFKKAKVTVQQGLTMLKEAGLQSLPGGGAEIFAPVVRQQICADKVDGDGWLLIHTTAHKLGMHSNATMLYGHVETYTHRIQHMEALRKAQDVSGGFNCFIPLKFRNHDNDMSHIAETSIIEDLKMYAIARIYMDNFAHLKAYWPMLGRNKAQLMLSFGVDDLDGTIDDSTKIYSMAGSEEQNPSMTTAEICDLITAVGRTPVERNSLYDIIENSATA
jgi:aminodeoxyfutalosine synthase